MTTCAESRTCTCGTCATTELPTNPFRALRVAHGMLLGETDFADLMGNPRGKTMLHNAWLHRAGVVWGFGITSKGTWGVDVAPGLALDGAGRELIAEANTCLDARTVVPDAAPGANGTRTVVATVVARFDPCPTAPVPTLADPCDLSRSQDEYSRIVERARIGLVRGAGPAGSPPCYPRVRVLFGLDDPAVHGAAGAEAAKARQAVAESPAAERTGVLLRAFRRLAARDSADLKPAQTPGGERGWFPVDPAQAAVPLAHLTIDVRDTDGHATVEKVTPHLGVRTALLPSDAVQELLCGSAVTVPSDEDAGGPRVDPDAVVCDPGEGLILVPVDRDVAEASARRQAVRVTSLSARGWIDEDVSDVRYVAESDVGRAIRVELAQWPRHHPVRLIVRGTGPAPVVGADLVPLAGPVGGPPGSRHDGHDAVLVIDNDLEGGSAS
jgi:hypothetical protein